MAASTALPRSAALPYGPWLSRLLRPIQRGFRLVNGALVAPALRGGLGFAIGTPITGHLMLLRTTGRKTRRQREVPLGYVIRDGAVWCVAGYGARTPWYLNLLDDPRVEVILPGRRGAHGVALPVIDDRAWLAAFRALIASFGLVGRIVVDDVDGMSDDEVLVRYRSLPVVRIGLKVDGRPIKPGRWDEGWSGAVAQAALVLFATVVVVVVRRLRLRR
jgi:deazaflavin-dependent oxidoreductase (nitroreductase family)